MIIKDTGNQTKAKEIYSCRFCGGELQLILSLGSMPNVNYFPHPEEIGEEKLYPLNFCICQSCMLAQLAPIVPSELIFREYHYVSGVSKPLYDHLRSVASECMKLIPDRAKKVLDIGCNDGTLLSFFAKRGYKTLGIDPAKTVVPLARAKGIPVLTEFFTQQEAIKIRRDFGRFDLIIATHTLANIVDLRDFLSGVTSLLMPEGYIVIEVGSLKEMVDRVQFDALYHEHYSYFSPESLSHILHVMGFSIVRLEKNAFHGGSLRIFTKKNSQNQKSKIKSQNNTDQEVSLQELREFAKKVRKYKSELRTILASLKGKRVVGFGAPAKGVTLLRYCGITKKQIAYVVDSTPLKQGRLMPGVHIPIFPEETLWNDPEPVDAILILSWNYKEEILRKIRKNFKKVPKIILPFSEELGL